MAVWMLLESNNQRDKKQCPTAIFPPLIDGQFISHASVAGPLFFSGLLSQFRTELRVQTVRKKQNTFAMIAHLDCDAISVQHSQSWIELQVDFVAHFYYCLLTLTLAVSHPFHPFRSPNQLNKFQTTKQQTNKRVLLPRKKREMNTRKSDNLLRTLLLL